MDYKLSSQNFTLRPYHPYHHPKTTHKHNVITWLMLSPSDTFTTYPCVRQPPTLQTTFCHSLPHFRAEHGSERRRHDDEIRQRRHVHISRCMPLCRIQFFEYIRHVLKARDGSAQQKSVTHMMAHLKYHAKKKKKKDGGFKSWSWAESHNLKITIIILTIHTCCNLDSKNIRSK